MAEDFSYKYVIKTKINRFSGEIFLTEGFEHYVNERYLQVIRTKEEAVKKALIELGWTPPPEKLPA